MELITDEGGLVQKKRMEWKDGRKGDPPPLERLSAGPQTSNREALWADILLPRIFFSL